MDESHGMEFSLTTPVARYRTPSGSAASAPVVLLGAGRQQARHAIVSRRLPSFGAVLVGRGCGSFWSETTGDLSVEAPALIRLFPEVAHSYGPTGGTHWLESWALFNGSLPYDAQAAGYITPASPVATPAKPIDTQRVMDRLVDDFDGMAPSLAGLLIHELLVTPVRADRPDEDPEMDRVAEMLGRDLAKAVNLTALATSLGLSPATLRRRFVARHGTPPKAYHLQARIDRAKTLLTLSDESIEAVAAAVGFEDSFYFSRLFRSREQCSPSEFRQRHGRL